MRSMRRSFGSGAGGIMGALVLSALAFAGAQAALIGIPSLSVPADDASLVPVACIGAPATPWIPQETPGAPPSYRNGNEVIIANLDALQAGPITDVVQYDLCTGQVLALISWAAGDEPYGVRVPAGVGVLEVTNEPSTPGLEASFQAGGVGDVPWIVHGEGPLQEV